MIQELGIEMITIPLPFRLNHVNCFLAEGEKGNVLIDTGLNNQAAKDVWDAKLEGKKIGQILLTNLHPDHSGYTGKLQEKINAEVLMSEMDAGAIGEIWTEKEIPIIRNGYENAGVPEILIIGMVELMRDFRTFVFPLPKVNRFLQEGEHIQIGKEAYEVIFTPGHSAGLICFYNKNKNVLLSTDHILPKITPNISYWFYGEENPLQSYENSLKKIKAFHVDYVIPSHGAPFYDANKRIDEIWMQHEDRLAETLEIMGKGATIFEVCQKIFSQQLSVHEYQAAIGETIAHLEYLRHNKECACEKHKGKWIYFRN